MVAWINQFDLKAGTVSKSYFIYRSLFFSLNLLLNLRELLLLYLDSSYSERNYCLDFTEGKDNLKARFDAWAASIDSPLAFMASAVCSYTSNFVGDCY